MANINSKDILPDKVKSVITSDVEYLADFHVDSDVKYTQMTNMTSPIHSIECDLGDVVLFREDLTSGFILSCAPSPLAFSIGAIVSENRHIQFCRKPSSIHQFFQGNGQEWEAFSKGGISYITTSFDRSSFEENYLKRTHQALTQSYISNNVPTSPHALSKFQIHVCNVIKFLQNKMLLPLPPDAEKLLSESIFNVTLEMLLTTLDAPIKAQPVSTRSKGVRKVIEYLHDNPLVVPTLSDLCHIAKLSERNLQYGFNESLGITPVRYARLIRLNNVKRDLLSADTTHTSITEIALKWGFFELGRFSGEYKKLFSELPSETLRRRNRRKRP